MKDEEAAIALANDSDFGLGGSVWTRDVARGARVASRVDTGMMFINNIDWSDAELPFGGIKNSGYGRELGDMGTPAVREQEAGPDSVDRGTGLTIGYDRAPGQSRQEPDGRAHLRRVDLRPDPGRAT